MFCCKLLFDETECQWKNNHSDSRPDDEGFKYPIGKRTPANGDEKNDDTDSPEKNSEKEGVINFASKYFQIKYRHGFQSLKATAHLCLLQEFFVFMVDIRYLFLKGFLRIDGNVGLVNL